MGKKSRPLYRNLLIVCEGSVTEPMYFGFLRKIALENGFWDEIEIRPKPRDEQEEDISNPHKSLRPRRQLQSIPIADDADNIEQKYQWRQMPVNFVKEARDGLKDDIFEEVWAVFDRNGHPAHKAAFALAQEPIGPKTVNVAFTSVAFEHWILLHFEPNDNAFDKSACKDKKGRYLDCGIGKHTDDCYGTRCVEGHLRTKTYIRNSTKKGGEDLRGFLQKLLEPERRHQAYENAAWLRNKVKHSAMQPYLVNPFTNVDVLLKRLLNEEDQVIEWANMGESKSVQSLFIKIDIVDNILECTIHNQSATTRLLNGVDIAIFIHQNSKKLNLQLEYGGNSIIPKGETGTFKLNTTTNLQDAVIEIKTGNHRLLVELLG